MMLKAAAMPYALPHQQGRERYDRPCRDTLRRNELNAANIALPSVQGHQATIEQWLSAKEKSARRELMFSNKIT